jgi:hypothetical protein
MTEQPRVDHETEAPARSRSDAAPWEYVRPDFRVLLGALPAGVFLVMNSLGPVQLAIGLSFVSSVFVFLRERHRGVIGFLALLSFVVVAISAGIGLALGSGRAFAAQNIVADVVIAVVFTISVLVGRPIVGLIARELVPAIQPVIAVAHPVFVQLTLVSVALNLGTAVARLFMIDALSTNQYVLLSRVVFIPLNIAFYVLCYLRIGRTAIAIWPADLPPPERIAR